MFNCADILHAVARRGFRSGSLIEPVFRLKPAFGIPQTSAAIAEGMMERFFLFLCFVNGIEMRLVFFGALKIATHINTRDDPAHEGPKGLPKMYYLIGNLLPDTFAVFYFVIRRLATGLDGTESR